MNIFIKYLAIFVFALLFTACEDDENKKIEEQAKQMSKEHNSKLAATPVTGNTTAFLKEMFTKQLQVDREDLPISVDEGVSCVNIEDADDAVEYTYELSDFVNTDYVDWDKFDEFYTENILSNANPADILARYCVREQKSIKYLVMNYKGDLLHVLNIPVDVIMQAHGG